MSESMGPSIKFKNKGARKRFEIRDQKISFRFFFYWAILTDPLKTLVFARVFKVFQETVIFADVNHCKNIGFCKGFGGAFFFYWAAATQPTSPCSRHAIWGLDVVQTTA